MIDPHIQPKIPFTVTEINEIERVVGRPVPEDYRDFVIEYGNAVVGGLVDGKDDFSVLAFFSASQVLLKLRMDEELRADGVLTFADCEFGNPYVLTRDDEVCYIDYCGETKVYKVADSFGHFLNRIVVPDE